MSAELSRALLAKMIASGSTEFISRDPMVMTTRSAYGYVGGDPLNGTDPSGMLDLPFGLCLRNPFGGDNDNGGCHTLIGTGQALHFGEFIGGVVASALALRFLNKACSEIASEGLAPSLENLTPKITRQMEQRGWTTEQIQSAVTKGQQIKAVNKATGGSATRYINPSTGQSVVIDDATGEVIHVGGPGFQYGPGSGDAP